MGIDVGFVHQIRWGAPRAYAFWDALSLYETDVDGSNRVALTLIKNARQEFEDEHNPNQWDIEAADAFVAWCEEYWRERGLEDEDAISVIFYY